MIECCPQYLRRGTARIKYDKDRGKIKVVVFFYAGLRVLWLVSPSCTDFLLCTCSCTVRKKQVPFSMALGNMELMHEYFPKHSAWEQHE